MPALAQTQPCLVSTIRTPRSARSTSRLSSRISSTSAGSLPSTAASSSRLGARQHRRRACGSAPPPWRRSSARRRRRRRPRARAAASRRLDSSGRRSPASFTRPSTSGSPRTGDAPRSALGLAHIPSALAVRLARPSPDSRARVSAITSAGVSRSRPSEASSSTPKAIAGLAGGGHVAGAAALAEGGDDRVRRAQRQGVGAGAVAVGDDADVALRDSGQQVVELARIQQRAVAGQQDDALGAVGFGQGDPGQRRLEWPPSLGSGTTSAPAVGGQLLGDRVAADDDRALDAARLADRLQHVGDHRRRQVAALARRRGRRPAAAWRRRSA